MNKEFVPYAEALALKELGIEFHALAIYTSFYSSGTPDLKTEWLEEYENYDIVIDAPLYQQAFRWFRKNYEMDSFVRRKYENAVKIGYFFGIDTLKYFEFIDFVSTTYKTYEEAELACLRKLIEIANEKR